MTILAMLFLSLASFAEPGTATLLRAFPEQVLRNEIVEFRPVPEHHFSAEAPQRCGSHGQLIERSPRAIKCQFTKAGDETGTLNVCDDKKTFCKPIQFHVSVSQTASSTPEKLVKNQMLNHELKAEMVPGFVEGTPAELRRKALSEGQPVFVMISTDWCPPCNQAKEYLFNTETFKKTTANWFKIYVDGDKLAAAEWENAVPYTFYPSMVLLNSKFEEVSRFDGRFTAKDFGDWAKTSLAQLDDPLTKVKARLESRLNGSLLQKIKDLIGDMKPAAVHADRVRLLKWALILNKIDLADRLLAQDEYPEIASYVLGYRLNQLERSDVADKDAQRIELEKKMLDAIFHEDNWAEYLAELCGQDKKACEPFLARIPERIKFLKSLSDVSSIEKAEILGDDYVGYTEIYSVLGNKKEEKKWAETCVKNYEDVQVHSRLKMSRSARQAMVACLEKVGEFARAEKILNPMIANYKNEPTFILRMARLKKAQKKYAAALKWADRASDLSYGYNWFNSQMIKVDVLLDMKKTQDAGRVIDEALRQINLDGGENSRNQSLVARFRGLQAKVQSLKN
jgi:hypothetical protein